MFVCHFRSSQKAWLLLAVRFMRVLRGEVSKERIFVPFSVCFWYVFAMVPYRCCEKCLPKKSTPLSPLGISIPCGSLMDPGYFWQQGGHIPTGRANDHPFLLGRNVPSLKLTAKAPEKCARPQDKKKDRPSTNQFSGVNSLLVSRKLQPFLPSSWFSEEWVPQN